jgi:hypothetical protein
MVDIGFSQLVHVPSKYFFWFNWNRFEWSPDDLRPVGRYSTDPSAMRSTLWTAALSRLQGWTGFLAREVLSPDLWEAAKTGGELPGMSGNPNLENTLFTLSEQVYVSQQLEEIKKFILKTEQIQENQERFLQERFDYFDESSKRLGRKDWLNLFMGALLGTVINLAIPPDKINELFRFAGTALGHLFSTPLALPGM